MCLRLAAVHEESRPISGLSRSWLPMARSSGRNARTSSTIKAASNRSSTTVSLFMLQIRWIRDYDLTLAKYAGRFLTTFEVISIFWGIWERSKTWLKPKIKPPNKVKLVQIPDTHSMVAFPIILSVVHKVWLRPTIYAFTPLCCALSK